MKKETINPCSITSKEKKIDNGHRNDKKENSCKYLDNKFAETLMNAIPYPFCFINNNDVFEYCNDAFLKYFTVSRKNIIGKRYTSLFTNYNVLHNFNDQSNSRNSRRFIYEKKFKKKDGSIKQAVIDEVIVYTDDLKTGILLIITDMTDENKAKEKYQSLSKLKDAILEINNLHLKIDDLHDFFQLILDKLFYSIKKADAGCIMLLDENNVLNICACIGYNKKKAHNFQIKFHKSFFWNSSAGDISKAIIINNIPLLCKKLSTSVLNNKKNFLIQSSLSAPIVINEKLFGLINIDSRLNDIFNDADLELIEYARNQIGVAVTNHMLYDKTVTYSRFDKQTKLYNRRYFEEIIVTIFEKALRRKDSLFLVIFDLNGLKKINDTYGHSAGDTLISYFASHLLKNIRKSDISARIGGDEFAAVFPKTNQKQIKTKLEKLRLFFSENPFIHDNNQFFCDFCYGIARFPKDGKSYEEIIKTADRKMYLQKKKLQNSKN